MGILGYIIMMATFLGLHMVFGVKPHIWMDAGLLLMFYALYYGVMARDVAEICTEKMVSGIGVSSFHTIFWPSFACNGILFISLSSITSLKEFLPDNWTEMFAPCVETSS